MKNIKSILLGIFLSVASLLVMNVDAAIMEDPKGYTGDVYVIGSTKFDNNYVITGSRAYEAGMNEVKFYLAFQKDLDAIDKTTYYFSGITKKWYVIPSEGGTVKKLNEEQEKKFENDLQIIFTNNVEKTIEFEYTGDVDPDSLIDGVEYVNGKFKMPATTRNFTFNKKDGSQFSIVNEYDEETWEPLLGEFKVEMNVELYVDGSYYGFVSLSEDGKISEEDFLNSVYLDEKKAVKAITLKDGSLIDFDNYIFKANDVINVTTEEAHFRYKGVNYNKSRLIEFLYQSSATYPVILLQDTVVSGLIKLDQDKENDMYLDLNGFTLSRDNESFLFYVTGKGNNLTINHGVLKSKTGQVITLGQEATEDQNIKVFINNDVVIEAGNIGISPIGKGARLEFNGKIVLTEEDSIGISGNGSEDCGGTEITINRGSSIKSKEEGTVALYLPQLGNAYIYGGDFETATVIGIKSGNLNISGGTFKAYGEKVEPKLYNNGVYATGDVIYVELNDAYDDNVTITTSNVLLESVNSNAILVYNPNNMKLPNIYSDNYGAATVYEDKNIIVYSNTENAVFEMNGIKFTKENFIDALKNSSFDKRVKLLNHYVSDDLITLNEDGDNDMYLDLGGYSLSRKNESFVIYMTGKGNKLNISNGDIISKTGTAITVGNASDVNQDIELNINEGVVIYAGEFGISVFGKGAKLNFNGTIALNDIDAVGISGNGTKGYGGTEINIYDKSNIVVYGDDNGPYEGTIALFLPQAGVTNIEGGNFNADLCVGIKAGTLNINGGVFNAIGESKIHTFSNNGVNPAGDAIYVEMNGNYDKPVLINISSAEINSSYGKQIFVYNPNKLQNSLTINANNYVIETLEEFE